MSHRFPKWGLLIVPLILCCTPRAEATILFSGDPVADGWLFGGDSQVTGASYVGGAPGNQSGNANYKLYSTTTTVTNEFLTACGSTCTAWLVGDVIVGLGAVFPNTVGTGAPTIQGVAVLKWGVTASVYSLSGGASPNGNGIRDHDNGDGGLGSIFATLNQPATTGTYAPTGAFQWTGTLGVPGLILLPVPPPGTVQSYIALNAQVVNTVNGNVFSSFEGYLNVSRLNVANPSGLGSFTYNGSSIVAYRNSANGPFLETNALIAGVPEPATGLLAGGALLAGWLIRRRKV